MSLAVLFTFNKKKMTTRDSFLNDFRGQTIGSINEATTPDEHFQNQVLRPILKLQNDLFLSIFNSYAQNSKVDFYNLTLEKKMALMENAVLKDTAFRNKCQGIIIGLFTTQEYDLYSLNASHLNKRMMSMLLERLKSQLQYFATK